MTGAVKGAGLGEGTGSIVNLQQERGGEVGVGNMAVLTETSSFFRPGPHPCSMPAAAWPSAVGNCSPRSVTCCLGDRRPDWH